MARILTNDFSWSKSRHEKLEECARAYYFHYYASWGGWDLKAPPVTRNLYLLKKLHNRWSWAGTVVHDVIKSALLDIRAGRAWTAEEHIQRAHRRMQEHYRHSAARLAGKEKRKDGFFGLLEHEYDEPVTAEEWKASWEGAKAALEWFFRSRWPSFARALPKERWLEVDEGFETSHFELEGVKVFAIPDFAYLSEEGTPVVVDWKTGKAREGYDAQVLGYALYLGTRYRFPPESVRAQLVYLNEGFEQDVQVDAAAVEGFRTHFRESVGRMRALLQDAASNQALGEDAFPPTTDWGRCARCAFRRPCGRTEATRLEPPNLPAATTP